MTVVGVHHLVVGKALRHRLIRFTAHHGVESDRELSGLGHLLEEVDGVEVGPGIVEARDTLSQSLLARELNAALVIGATFFR